ncbi:response regulator [Arenibacter troitsensis]|uniref:histidine kinase n=1 Tax=Arenibacter troitsensis TaxID=188872 RepID=A0A1X7LF08_9FLAO|nr:PAS domain S-box protein [Arenibacter troitsensis]SMG52428.1 PAS domain S-box-containing protein [Arenibacter troitsensis]
MIKDKTPYHILVIEDNPGDIILIQDFLEEWILNPTIIRAHNYNEARILFEQEDFVCHCILLDLTLPDKSGEALIIDILSNNIKVPIIVLTGFDSFPFALKSLSLGISDYLLKEDLSAISLYKSIVYNIEKKKTLISLQESEDRYSKLFHISPLPMWLFDIDSLRFLDVNQAAMDNYGYDFDEFMSMTLKDLRPETELDNLEELITKIKESKSQNFNGILTHKKKSNELIQVEIFSSVMDAEKSEVRLVLAHDITDKLKRIDAIEKQNKKLKEIAWLESHVVRAPLARIIGLVNMLDNELLDEDERSTLLQYIKESTQEMDEIVREVVQKAEALSLNNGYTYET